MIGRYALLSIRWNEEGYIAEAADLADRWAHSAAVDDLIEALDRYFDSLDRLPNERTNTEEWAIAQQNRKNVWAAYGEACERCLDLLGSGSMG